MPALFILGIITSAAIIMFILAAVVFGLWDEYKKQTIDRASVVIGLTAATLTLIVAVTLAYAIWRK